MCSCCLFHCLSTCTYYESISRLSERERETHITFQTSFYLGRAEQTEIQLPSRLTLTVSIATYQGQLHKSPALECVYCCPPIESETEASIEAAYRLRLYKCITLPTAVQLLIP